MAIATKIQASIESASWIRKMFEEQLAREGAAFNMPDEAYR